MSTMLQPLSPSHLVTKGVLRAARDLRLTGTVLARITGLSTATISRLRRGDWQFQEGTKAYEIAMVLLHIHQTLEAVMQGNLDRMRAWITARNADLGGAPLTLLERIQGLFRVLLHLQSLRTSAP